MKVFIQIAVRYSYTASESSIQLFIPISLHWYQLQKNKILLEYHMQKLMVNNTLNLTRCLVRCHRVVDEAIEGFVADTEQSYQRRSECFFTQPSTPAAVPAQLLLHQRHCENKKIQRNRENEYMAGG